MIQLQKVKDKQTNKKKTPKKGESREIEMKHYLEGKIIQITASHQKPWSTEGSGTMFFKS